VYLILTNWTCQKKKKKKKNLNKLARRYQKECKKQRHTCRTTEKKKKKKKNIVIRFMGNSIEIFVQKTDSHLAKPKEDPKKEKKPT
jgi:hypothetical protein